MASGYYTGHQHSLIDMKDLSLEKFAEWCDDTFFGKGYFGYKTIEEARHRMQKNLEDARKRLDEHKREYGQLLTKSVAELHVEYDAYTVKTKEDNEHALQVFREETEKLERIKKWAKLMPQLDYVWDEFKDPTLWAETILPFGEWYKQSVVSAKRSIEFGEKHVAEFEEKAADEREITAKYDVARQALLDSSK